MKVRKLTLKKLDDPLVPHIKSPLRCPGAILLKRPNGKLSSGVAAAVGLHVGEG